MDVQFQRSKEKVQTISSDRVYLRWTEELKDNAARMLSYGKSHYEIATALGVSPSTVGYACHRYQLRQRYKPLKARARWTEEMKETVKLMLKKGKSEREIAKELGISFHSVVSACSKYSLKERRRTLRITME